MCDHNSHSIPVGYTTNVYTWIVHTRVCMHAHIRMYSHTHMRVHIHTQHTSDVS